MTSARWLAIPLLVASTAFADTKTIAKGDRLSTLCEKRYGNEHYDELVALHNGLKSAADLRVGQTISLPTLTEMVEKEAFEGSARQAALEVAAAHVSLASIDDILRRRTSDVDAGLVADSPMGKALGEAERLLRSAIARLSSIARRGKSRAQGGPRSTRVVGGTDKGDEGRSVRRIRLRPLRCPPPPGQWADLPDSLETRRLPVSAETPAYGVTQQDRCPASSDAVAIARMF